MEKDKNNSDEKEIKKSREKFSKELRKDGARNRDEEMKFSKEGRLHVTNEQLQELKKENEKYKKEVEQKIAPLKKEMEEIKEEIEEIKQGWSEETEKEERGETERKKENNEDPEKETRKEKVEVKKTKKEIAKKKEELEKLFSEYEGGKDREKIKKKKKELEELKEKLTKEEIEEKATEEEVSKEEEERKTEEELRQELLDHLESETLGTKNRKILEESRLWGKIKHLGAGIGGAVTLKQIIKRFPDTVPFADVLKTAGGGVVGGAIAGVGLKAGSYAYEAYNESKQFTSFKEELDEKIEEEEKSPEEIIKEKMENMDSEISIIKARIAELNKQKSELKKEGVWFFQKERREVSAKIKEQKKMKEMAEDQFRYSSVELKKRSSEVSVKDLAEELMEKKDEQLREIKSIPGEEINDELLSNLLKTVEEESSETLEKKITEAESGLSGKLKQRNESWAKEVMKSAALCGAIGGVADYVWQTEIIQDGFESLRETIEGFVDSSTEASNLGVELSALTAAAEETTVETLSEISAVETEYVVEQGDSAWSLTEEFLYENWGEEMKEINLSEAQKTYIIDYITTLMEADAESFGLDLAEGETIDHLFAESEHKINFEILFENGELEKILAEATDLSSEEVAEILENNEKIKEFAQNNPETKLTPELIDKITVEEAGLTEEMIAEQVSVTETQLEGMETWLEDLKEGNLNEAHFDFMAGNEKEIWIENLAEVEGVSPEEMEEMIIEGYEETISSEAGEASQELSAEQERIVQDWVERMESEDLNLGQYEALLDSENEVLLEEIAERKNMSTEEIKEIIKERAEVLEEEAGEVIEPVLGTEPEAAAEASGETAAESTGEAEETISESETSSREIYQSEGTLTRQDRWAFFEAFEDRFQNQFGKEVNGILIESDIISVLESGDVTPEELVDWAETEAFEEPIDFGGEHPPKQDVIRIMENLTEEVRNASDSTRYNARRNALKDQIRNLILYGK